MKCEKEKSGDIPYELENLIKVENVFYMLLCFLFQEWRLNKITSRF